MRSRDSPNGLTSTIKAGAVVERIAGVGTKIGGPAGDAFAAGVRATVAGSLDAMKVLQTILDAPDILAREAAVAAKKALAEIATHIPAFEASLAGIDNGHMNNEPVESATSGTGVGSSSGSGHGGSSSTGYDPHNYNPDGSQRPPGE